MALFPSFLTIFLTLGPGAFAYPGSSPRVYGGYQVSITSAPWMAHLKYYFKMNGSDWVSSCGGTILNEMHILTAAHCATEEVPGGYRTNTASKYEIRVGSANRDSGGSLYKVARVIPHPGYTYTVRAHDLAILKLTTKITYNRRTVQTVRLDSGEYKAGQKVSSMGWGKNPENPDTPFLFMVDLNIFDIAKCAKQKGGSVSEYQQHKICTTGPKKADVCQGDSGGPLMVGHNNQQIGIVSYGPYCPQPNQGATSAGVYTKIADNMAWINSVVSGSKDGEDETCSGETNNHQPTINKPLVEEVRPVVSEEDD